MEQVKPAALNTELETVTQPVVGASVGAHHQPQVVCHAHAQERLAAQCFDRLDRALERPGQSGPVLPWARVLPI